MLPRCKAIATAPIHMQLKSPSCFTHMLAAHVTCINCCTHTFSHTCTSVMQSRCRRGRRRQPAARQEWVARPCVCVR